MVRESESVSKIRIQLAVAWMAIILVRIIEVYAMTLTVVGMLGIYTANTMLEPYRRQQERTLTTSLTPQEQGRQQ
jgi:hypothetical protein